MHITHEKKRTEATQQGTPCSNNNAACRAHRESSQQPPSLDCGCTSCSPAPAPPDTPHHNTQSLPAVTSCVLLLAGRRCSIVLAPPLADTVHGTWVTTNITAAQPTGACVLQVCVCVCVHVDPTPNKTSITETWTMIEAPLAANWLLGLANLPTSVRHPGSAIHTPAIATAASHGCFLLCRYCC
jgi:hypothetical protein